MPSHDDSLTGPFDTHAVHDFLLGWTDLADPGVGERLLAPVILVGGPAGTSAIPREGFLRAVVSRQQAMSGLPGPELGAVDVMPLGEQRLVVTALWHVEGPGGPLELVGDFLLERTAGPGLRALAYLPRTDVTVMVAAQAPVEDEAVEPDAGAVRS